MPGSPLHLLKEVTTSALTPGTIKIENYFI